MATFLYTNNATSTLASGITAVATSIFLNTGDGAKFPSPTGIEQFALTLDDGAGNIEIVYCTTRATDTLTVVRAREGTTGYAFLSGDAAELRMTKATMESWAQKDGVVQGSLNADQVDGYDAAEANTASTVVARTAANNISCTTMTIAGAATSTVTGAELEHCNGLTENVQTALDTIPSIPITSAQMNEDATSQHFTSSGTFTAPAYINTVFVTIIGGGGGGGGGEAGDGANGGDGGSKGLEGDSLWHTQAVTPASGYTVTVGAGGAGGAAGTGNGEDGAAGSAGGTSTFDATNVSGGTGGVGGSGQTETNGGTGDDLHGYGTGGAGGAFNGGANANNVGSPGSAGSGRGAGGGGGGGGGLNAGVDGGAGGAGTAGLVIVRW